MKLVRVAGDTVAVAEYRDGVPPKDTGRASVVGRRQFLHFHPHRDCTASFVGRLDTAALR